MALHRIQTNEEFRRVADAGDGFILAVNGREGRIHLASCFHLTDFKTMKADFTSKPKVFSSSRDELSEHATAQLGLRLVPCKTCGG